MDGHMPEKSFEGQKHGPAQRIWTFIRIMNVRLRFIFLMVLVGLVVGYWENINNYYDRWRRPATAEASVQAAAIEYYCPMHPNVIRDAPGSCPICGMPLSKRAKSDRPPLPEGVLSQVQLTPYKLQMGRISTSPVDYQLLDREIRTVGIVGYDETRRAFIAARIKGRIEKLFVNYVGQHVEKGTPLALMYSPDYLVAQGELLTAMRDAARQKEGTGFDVAAARALVQASRTKLMLWGITTKQIDEIVKRGTAEQRLTLYSPIAGIVTEKNVLEGHYVDEGADLYTIADLSHVWMEVKIFENQIEGVTIGTAVEVRSTASPDEMFAGRITFIAYSVDPETRTISARVEIDNPDVKLKPGMYANAVIRIPVGHIEVLAENAATAPAATAESDEAHADHAATSAPAVSTDALVHAYLTLASSYASDKTDDDAARDLAKQAAGLGSSTTLDRDGPEGIRDRAKTIANAGGLLPGKDLKTQRKMFQAISAGVIELVKAVPPHEHEVNVAHCPMVKADWLQTGKAVRNPYYGSEMLGCGEITGTIRPAGAKSEDKKFATGYYCPITPGRLYEKPEHCPVDKFPMKRVRVEKALAVPTSAVVDTGTRKVVYRESAPGTFDMIEVKVGERAGEYYPVLSGLNDGDRVATAGAFLVDAENRLNPPPSAQFFGATGGPNQK